MAYTPNYPATVAEVIKTVKYKPSTLAALANFRRSKPFKGDVWERRDKIQKLYTELAASYGVPTPQLLIGPGATDCYIPTMHLIQLNADKLSGITALHEFGHSIGKDEKQTCTWSLNLFRIFFPKAFAKLNANGHMLQRPVVPHNPVTP